MPINLWNLRLGSCGPLDVYPLARPILFRMDPEDAHERMIRFLAHGPSFLKPCADKAEDPILDMELFGLKFPNPVGLAAGLDKQAEAMDALMNFGFGSVELGTVTPRPQPGNPRPRMFRVPEARALINRFGFNSVGVDVFTERLKAWREHPARTRNPVGVNLSKNKDSALEDDTDYVTSLHKVAPYADYVTVNVSSPNTPGLRGSQTRERLERLLDTVLAAREKARKGLPVLLKIAPDLSEPQQEDIAAAVVAAKHGGVQGLIISNTTISRASNIPSDLAQESGGLSGTPLYSLSTRVLGNMYRLTEGKVPLVGCGGVSTGEDAYAKIRAGASLVQIYTALVYEGPLVISRIKRELAALLRRDGFRSVSVAVGRK